LGLAVAALVLGVASIVLSPFLIGSLAALIGLPLAVLHLLKGGAHRTVAWWAASLSALGLVLSSAMGVVYYRWYRHYADVVRTASSAASPVAAEWVGVAAPNVVLTTVNGERIELASLKGRRVVLNFWATWCAACREEMPHLDRLARETPASELMVVAVSEEQEDILQAFARKHGLQVSMASASGLPAPFGEIQSIPTTVFIDGRGVIQDAVLGGLDYDTLRTRALAADSVRRHPRAGKTVPAAAP
jgi:thiol-disulfide isomerase/thioredoxin